jgi:hypothetical protein
MMCFGRMFVDDPGVENNEGEVKRSNYKDNAFPSELFDCAEQVFNYDLPAISKNRHSQDQTRG